MKKLTLIALFFLSLISFVTKAADIKVNIDRNQIELNESFTLTFEANESVDDDPDFSPLEKDFQILSNRTSNNMSIVNGQYSRSQRWNITLVAKHKGEITIPSISFGSDSSPQYKINIKAVQKTSGKAGEEFMSELDIDVSSAYPQAQIIVTQRLLSSRNINGYEFSNLTFSGVDAISEPLGEIKQYQTTRGNKAYLVLEQNHLIFPQSAGTLTIEPSVASARVTLNNNSYRSNTKTIRRASAEKTINVKPIPKNFKAKHWLAAKEVQLVEEFPENKTFNVGEPITRTLVLITDGQSSTQQPEFITTDIKGLKQYPDKPLLKDNKSETGITGIQQIKVALIPSRTGSFTLPAISVPWWNTQTNKMEIARIPARTFTAAPASTNAPQNNIGNTSPTNEILTPIIDPIDSANSPEMTAKLNTEDNSLVWKLISLFLALGWIITLFLYGLLKQKPKEKQKKVEVQTESKKSAIKKLKIACDANDAANCKDALINWANTLFINKPAYSLGELSLRVDEPLAENIKTLNSFLYTQNNDSWVSNNLFQQCVEFMNNYDDSPDAGKNTNSLESLYK